MCISIYFSVPILRSLFRLCLCCAEGMYAHIYERAYEEWNYVSRGFRISHWLLSERVPAWLTVYLTDLASAGFLSSPASLHTFLIPNEWGSECPNGCVSHDLILSHASFNFVLNTTLMAQWRWIVLIVLIIYWWYRSLCNRKTERERMF